MELNVNHLATDTGSMSMEIQQKLLQHSNGWTLIASQLLNVKKSGESKLSDHDNNAPNSNGVTSCMGDSGGPLTTEE